MLLGEASRPVDVWVLVSRRLNGWHSPVAWQVTGLHLVGGIRPWCDPITLTFAAYRRLLRQFWFRPKTDQRVSLLAATAVRKFAA
jgi:hypothetical protein